MKNLLLRIFDVTGFYITKSFQYNHKSTFSIGDFTYSKILPTANFSPWLSDKAFMDIFPIAKKNSLVDIYRAYELWQLIEKQVSKFPHDYILEIGVWKGGTGLVMSKKMELLKASNPIYLADTFTGVVKTSDKDTFYTGNEHHETSKQHVDQLLSTHTKQVNYSLLEGIFPDDTAHLIADDQQCCLCHIDVDVYDSAKDIVEWIFPKLTIGGIIVFDDYGFHFCTGVTRLVEEYRNHPDKIIIHNLNGHALLIKTA
ncbi:MAG: class I SAM-dependent methyltransferase [Bacteroidetes bacterium]|jgi:O-methyltransferase|nr:class I SAM-dependent methyltransferase [Bacteroidota bacterium]MBK7039531.1 class I SAM-dependent methyltransferase [Bacteroidota bacterium]MBK8330063.1 class I SAM-dependent methyltransferase [Bacteroidota bacterium]HQW46459.1 TylF/MycF/NovP-related O-methyltransferase [Chitinophagaceae bacterium]